MNEKVKAAAAAKRTMIFGVISGALIALYGLFISRSHITEVGYWMHLRALEAETMFIFIDFIAIYGKVLTSKRLAAKTRRIGYKLLLGGGIASLACNVWAGFITKSLGESCYGAGIVAIVAVLEYAIANTKAKTISTTQRQPRKAAEPVLTARQIGALKGAETRRRNALAPVSPGVGPIGDYVGRKA